MGRGGGGASVEPYFRIEKCKCYVTQRGEGATLVRNIGAMEAHTHTHTRTYMHAHTCTHTHAYTRTHEYTRAYIRAHTHAHTFAHTRYISGRPLTKALTLV